MDKKRTRNKAELNFIEFSTKHGWEVTKRGWPDFACFKGRRLVLVEVKKARTIHLKREQMRLMKALAKRGVECYRWSPDAGFEKVLPRTGVI